MRELNFGRAGVPKGEARALVVFLHGYGSDGQDLLGMADFLAPYLPGVAFVAPDAPERCVAGGYGYQWFPLPAIDGSPQAVAEAGLDAATVDLHHFLDARLADEGVPEARLALVGFSQGAMMALHIAPRRAQTIAAVVAISGQLLRPEALATEVVSRPPVMLIHGNQDEVVPFFNLSKAADALVATNIPTLGHVMEGVGHGITPDGLEAALNFLRMQLVSEAS